MAGKDGVSPWGIGRRGVRPTDITWMPEDVELGPEWLRDELLQSEEELKKWMADLDPKGTATRRVRQGRGRPRNEAQE